MYHCTDHFFSMIGFKLNTSNSKQAQSNYVSSAFLEWNKTITRHRVVSFLGMDLNEGSHTHLT